MQHDAVILGLQRCAVLLLVPIRVAVLLNELALFVALALGHLEVELILVLELGLQPQPVQHVPLLVVVLGPQLIVLLLLEQAQVLPCFQLRALPVLAPREAVLES